MMEEYLETMTSNVADENPKYFLLSLELDYRTTSFIIENAFCL
jgi:hypothetical protein